MSTVSPTLESPLTAILAQLRSRVDKQLREYVAFSGDCPLVLGESMLYSVVAGG